MEKDGWNDKCPPKETKLFNSGSTKLDPKKGIPDRYMITTLHNMIVFVYIYIIPPKKNIRRVHTWIDKKKGANGCVV